MMDDNKYITKPKRRIKWNYHDYNNMKTEQCVFIVVKFKLKNIKDMYQNILKL